MLTFTCPRCQEGRLFVKRSAYTKGMAEMYKRCSVCNQNFNPEPGFYFGAAYVSYALAIALLVAVYVALTTFDALGFISFSFFDDATLYLIVSISLLIILLPILYRQSRAIWISFFVKYDSNAARAFFKKAKDDRASLE